jgi:BirA family biotin operon repressor/biotin-[acetyl-CoA-carboxylase] ligase
LADKEKLRSLLKTEYIGKSLYCFETIGSTNDFLKGSAEALDDGSLVCADEQISGKGRRGHVWITPKSQTAAFSFLLKGRLCVDAPPITLMCGLATAKALRGLCGLDFLIKWPNDVVCDGKKICGILCESKLSDTRCITVCGIGINLTQNEEYFVKAGIPNGASLKMLTGKAYEPEEVISATVNEFEKIYMPLANKKEGAKAAFFEEYCSLCVTLGKEIRAIGVNSEVCGIAESINDDGSLNVKTGGKTVRLMAGDVSVRGIMGYV